MGTASAKRAISHKLEIYQEGKFLTRWVVLLIAFLMAMSGCATSRAGKSQRTGLFARWGNSGSSRSVAGLPSEDRTGSGDVIASVKGMGLRWPLTQVQVTSSFGSRRGEFHEGIDLRANTGTPVYAAQSGKVLYSGRRIRGYGKMVVISHRSGIATVYAHNSKLLVRRGQRVIQGQRVAVSGNTGHTRGPHLHFEVRSGVKAMDPLHLLPSPMESRIAHFQNQKKKKRSRLVATK